MLGTSSRKDSASGFRHAMIFLDFATLQTRQCGADDFERWYVQTSEFGACLMGHKVSHAWDQEVGG